MDQFSQLERMLQLRREKESASICKQCGEKMSYKWIDGIYYCKSCGYQEKDTFGKIKGLLEMNPTLSKMEISMMLHMPLRELNKYIVNGIVQNPRPFSKGDE